jgi:hypothetical protein
MILISHRGNLTGPNPFKENSLQYIQKALLGDPKIQRHYLN